MLLIRLSKLQPSRQMAQLLPQLSCLTELPSVTRLHNAAHSYAMWKERTAASQHCHCTRICSFGHPCIISRPLASNMLAHKQCEPC